MKIRWVAIVLLSAGCATVLKRPAERIAVDSRPSGCDAVIDCAGGSRSNADRIAQAVTGADRQNGRGFRHFPDEIAETLEPVH